MEFEECRLFQSIDSTPFHKVAAQVLELTESGRDVNIRDKSGRTFLHHVADRPEKFNDPRAVPVVYQLCLAGIDIDAVEDERGDTALHLLARKGKARRMLIALLRFGADISIQNRAGQTAADILEEETPPGGEEMKHWLSTYTPGLFECINNTLPDVAQLERLLQSYCRTSIVRKGETIDLIELASKKCTNNRDTVVALLDRHKYDCELALSVLAGSSKRTTALLQKSQGNVNQCDHLYQCVFPHTPRVPQPLLAAAWEQDNYDIIDAIMTFKPDTSVLYSNMADQDPMPLFFHLLSGTPKPTNVAIVHRVIRDSDLRRRNRQGQTILFEAMREGLPIEFIKALLKYGANVAARDYKGRTTREYAEILEEPDYVTVIDDHVLSIIRDKKIKELELLVVTGYTYINDLLKEEREGPRRLCERLKEERALKEMAAYVQTIPVMQVHKRRLFLAIDNGNLQRFTRLAQAPLVYGQNKCGHSMLHRALLSRRDDVAAHIVENFPHTAHLTDNMLRTPLHYAALLFGPDHQVFSTLVRHGADPKELDVYGKTAYEYNEHSLTTYEYQNLFRDVTEFDSRVYLREMQFEETLKDAIQRGCLDDIRALMDKAARHIHDMSSYSKMLFTCVDCSQPDIAAYLIRHGADPEVWRKYNENGCSRLISLHDRACDLGYQTLADYVDKVRKQRAAKDLDGHRIPTSFDNMANHGNITFF